jgi:hypothetical protein
MTRFWLSFADDQRPAGDQSLGVCIVEALDVSGALAASHALGINPGGEVRFLAVDESVAGRLTFDLAPYMNRLIQSAEARELADRIRGELGS